jgi:hypothetical protein
MRSEKSERAQQSRFTGPVGTEDREASAARDVEVTDVQ